MFKAILYKDAISLKQKKGFLLLQFLIVVGSVLVIKLSEYGSGIQIIGKEYVHFFIVTISALSCFLELYLNFLIDDGRDMILPLISLNKLSFPTYIIARVMMPLLISAIYCLCALVLYLFLIDSNSLASGFLIAAAITSFSEIVLASGIGLCASLTFDIDLSTNPNIAIPFICINAFLLYFFNPSSMLPIFSLVTCCCGLACMIICRLIMRAKYKIEIE